MIHSFRHTFWTPSLASDTITVSSTQTTPDECQQEQLSLAFMHRLEEEMTMHSQYK